jgi:GNAT superfamily N-acetyltransferase
VLEVSVCHRTTVDEPGPVAAVQHDVGVLTHGRYEIDPDPERVELDALYAFLAAEAYWATWRSKDDVRHQVATAWRVVGAYSDSGELVGFARAVSDGCDIAYLADVYVLRAHRGQGLARALLQEMIENGPGADFRWMLHTRDAHGLYRKFGFAEPDQRFMERPSGRPA